MILDETRVAIIGIVTQAITGTVKDSIADTIWTWNTSLKGGIKVLVFRLVE